MDKRQMKRIGARIREAREARGMKQEDLAPMLGFTTAGAISSIELGKTAITPLDIIKLARIFDLPIWWLYGEVALPKTYPGWLLLCEGDEERARAHHELELSFRPKGG